MSRSLYSTYAICYEQIMLSLIKKNYYMNLLYEFIIWSLFWSWIVLNIYQCCMKVPCFLFIYLLAPLVHILHRYTYGVPCLHIQALLSTHISTILTTPYSYVIVIRDVALSTSFYLFNAMFVCKYVCVYIYISNCIYSRLYNMINTLDSRMDITDQMKYVIHTLL